MANLTCTLLPTSSPSNAEPKHFLELQMRCAQFSSRVAEDEFSKGNVIFSILSYVLWFWDVSNALWWTLVFEYMCAESNLFCLFEFLFGKAWLFSAVCLSPFPSLERGGEVYVVEIWERLKDTEMKGNLWEPGCPPAKHSLLPVD